MILLILFDILPISLYILIRVFMKRDHDNLIGFDRNIEKGYSIYLKKNNSSSVLNIILFVVLVWTALILIAKPSFMKVPYSTFFMLEGASIVTFISGMVLWLKSYRIERLIKRYQQHHPFEYTKQYNKKKRTIVILRNLMIIDSFVNLIFGVLLILAG